MVECILGLLLPLHAPPLSVLLQMLGVLVAIVIAVILIRKYLIELWCRKRRERFDKEIGLD